MVSSLLSSRACHLYLRIRRLNRERAIVPLADNTSRSGLAYINVSGVNPRAKLLSDNHPEKTQQGNNGRRRTLYPDETVQNSYTQTNYKGYKQDFHRISPA
jgi:hypothetical protein